MKSAVVFYSLIITSLVVVATNHEEGINNSRRYLSPILEEQEATNFETRYPPFLRSDQPATPSTVRPAKKKLPNFSRPIYTSITGEIVDEYLRKDLYDVVEKPKADKVSSKDEEKNVSK